jgi:hypothetical protein
MSCHNLSMPKWSAGKLTEHSPPESPGLLQSQLTLSVSWLSTSCLVWGIKCACFSTHMVMEPVFFHGSLLLLHVVFVRFVCVVSCICGCHSQSECTPLCEFVAHYLSTVLLKDFGIILSFYPWHKVATYIFV